MSELNATPRTTEDPSPASATLGVVVPKIVQGHEGGPARGATGFDGDESGPVPDELDAEIRKV
jgi:hypothetical protein